MILDMFKLTDKVAVVTGAGTGIGHGISLGLAEAGANIVCVGRRTEALEGTAAEVRRLGRRSLVVSADVTKTDQIDKLVGSAIAEYARIDILVNNAGGGYFIRSMDLTEGEWDALLRLNLTSVMLCSKAVARVMMAQNSGNIINISSNCGRFGTANMSVYSAAKAGVNNLTASLAWEWSPYHIRVNCIAPGMVLHERSKGLFNALPEEANLGPLLIRRLGTAEDIAAAAVYLASEASSWVTGQTINIDGGLRYSPSYDNDFVDSFSREARIYFWGNDALPGSDWTGQIRRHGGATP